MTEYAQVSTATETRAAAIELARSATAGRLAAGAQVVGPVLSVAWHRGELVEAEEWQLVLKTSMSRVAALCGHLVDNHPWQNPEVSVTPLDPGTDAYRNWLDRASDPSDAD
jgi:periplasmic divalent cation tolerance protein